MGSHLFMHQVEVLLDGESVRGRVMIDRTGTTTLTQVIRRHNPFSPICRTPFPPAYVRN